MARFVVERLDPTRHDVPSFVCADARYTNYLRDWAVAHADKGFSTTYVGVVEGTEADILGYVTLSMGQITKFDLNDKAQKKAPPFPIPVLHLGKLATAQKHKGKQVGPRLVKFAMRTTLEMAAVVGCHALQLVAAQQSLVGYYKDLDFTQIRDDALLMYMQVSTIKDAIDNPPVAADAQVDLTPPAE